MWKEKEKNVLSEQTWWNILLKNFEEFCIACLVKLFQRDENSWE